MRETRQLVRRSIRPELSQVRAETENDKKVLTGYAVVWNSMSLELDEGNGPFKERVLPNAFTESLQVRDLVMLGHHDEKIVIGRISAGTLRAVEDDHGLRVLNYPPESPNGQNIYVAVARGDLKSMSFGFYVVEERWVDEDGMRVREIVKADLDEVSVVVWPAYPESSIKVRSLTDHPVRTLDVEVLRLRQRHLEQF